VTARLVQLLQGEIPSGRIALEQIARELQHPDPDAVITFGAGILDHLRQQGAILGVCM